MVRVLKRVAAKRDLTDHFVFLGENASVDVARRFLHAANVSFQALAKMPELGAQRSFRNHHFSCSIGHVLGDVGREHLALIGGFRIDTFVGEYDNLRASGKHD